MQIVNSFPDFEISFSNISDGNYRDRNISPHTIRPLSQVHGTDIFILREENIEDPIENVDGIYTRMRGISIGCLSADCPIVLIMGDHECAALHSGWRGTQGDIVSRGLSMFATSPRDIKAYIAPHIGKDSYKVGEEFYSYFDEKYLRKKYGKIYLDLGHIIVDQLLAYGVKRENIDISTIDTFRDLRYHSYRRDHRDERACMSVKMF